MEAVPKLQFIKFDLKTSPELCNFGPKLNQYIAEAYREDPETYSDEIYVLECLRSAAVRPTMDEEGINCLNKYFWQLRAMQSRFPMAKGQQAAVSFSWRDLYAHMTCALADVRFEMACILYNIGALHTHLASFEARNTADSLKAACTHYQNAAWAFQYLKEQFPQPPGVDVSTEIMRLLQKICFAQAQECILEKSIQDTRKPSVVGAVAAQVLLFYKNALAVLGPSAGTDTIHEIIGTKLYNHWHRYLSFKSAYISCIVYLYHGMHAEEQQKMGERVAFYQHAADRLFEARKLAKYIEPKQVTEDALTFTNDVVEGKRKAAKNENEFIYHEEVPEKDLLTEMKPVCLVKAIPINFNDPQISGMDIFMRLVPICAHEASSMYSEEKAKVLRKVVSQAEAKNTELTEFMSSLQLDQLEIIDSEHGIPQEIVDRCAAMNAKPEVIQSLVDSMNNLAEIISDVEHSLAEIKTLIQEETMKEKEYQKGMGPRPPSIVQTELSREYHKYLEAHTRTTDSNQVLHKAMTLHIANLKLLALPLDELQAKIPSIHNIEGLDRETMAEMGKVVLKAREMQSQRDHLVQKLREEITNDDITSQLLARSSEPTEEIFKAELEKHKPKVHIIELNLSAQENVINKLTSLYASYGDSRRMLTDVLRKRDGLINALVTSYDAYEELLAKSQKGLEFYKKLAHNVSQLQTRLKGTCQVHNEEREQLLAKNNKPTPTVTATPSALPQTSDAGAPRAKLKDYLPYMKTRSRSTTPQAQLDPMTAEAYYPETIYPSTIRPAPVGSEATDPQMQLPDGVIPQMQYDRYVYAETDQYSNYAYPATSKAFDKDDSNYGYSSPYTPQQYSAHVSDPSHQNYSNPYYSATHNNTTLVTDSQSSMQYPNQSAQNQFANQPQLQANLNPNPYANNTNLNQPSQTMIQQIHPNNAVNQPTNQANVNPNPYQYDTYPQSSPANPIPDVVPSYNNQADLNASFSQMHVSAPKSEPAANFGPDYTQTYFSVQYPQATTPNYATYSHSMNTPSNSNMMTSQTPSDYSSLNYPYSSDSSQYDQTGNPQYGQTGQNVPNSGNNMAYGQVASNYGQGATNAPNHNPSAQFGQPGNSNVVNSGANTPYGQASGSNVASPAASAQYGQPGNLNVNPTASAQYGQPGNPNVNPNIANPNASAQYSQPGNPNVANPGQPGYPAQVNQPSNPQLSNTSTDSYGQPGNFMANPNQITSEPHFVSSHSYSNLSQGYPTYTNAESAVTSTTNIANPASSLQGFQETGQGYPGLSHLDDMDKPIKSHATGQALSALDYNYQKFDIQSGSTSTQPTEQSYPTNYNPDQSNVNYTQGYQNHPGYTFNSASGGYDYSYGSQNAYTTTTYNSNQGNSNIQQSEKDSNLPAHGVYTSAGVPGTVQSPSETPQGQPDASNNHIYYNTPYGYITNTNQAPEMSQNQPTNYGANVNQSTYMQSGQMNNTNVTDTNYQVSSPTENIQEPKFDQTGYNQIQAANQQNTNQTQDSIKQPSVDSVQNHVAEKVPDEHRAVETPPVAQNTAPIKLEEITPDVKPEPSVFDLLSDIDFTVEHKPLMPEINVPQMSESSIKKPIVKAEVVVKTVVKEEVIERPAKRDLFSDPGLLNQFTQEVKNLQRLTDSLTNKAGSGLTVLDSKWKTFQDLQNKENMTRSKTVAMQHSTGNIVTEVVPYDDSRLTLQSDPDAYINASYYKQLAPWCVPLVVSKNPTEDKYSIFWKAVLEKKISCIVCLLSEIEMQGKSYWPTAKGQSLDLSGLKVTLDEVACTVHWTERKLTVTSGKTVLPVTHYQMNVFPAKIVCSPLVLLVDKILALTYDNRLSNQLSGAWIQCSDGAGRSAVVSLLCMLVCQVRAGQLKLCEMLDEGCATLCKHRSNVLEDTKYLADAYRAALFYVQGVLLSGTTSFSGEAVSSSSGASVLPPPPALPRHKYSRESFEEMQQAPGLTSGDMKDPLNFLDPLWSLKKK